MTPHHGTPNPEKFAAYIDGECEGRDDLADLKQHIEGWLAENPEARAELASYRRLLQAWQDTTPAEPESAQWAAVLARVVAPAEPVPLVAAGEGVCRLPQASSTARKLLRRAAILGGFAAALAGLLFLWPGEPKPAPHVPSADVVQNVENDEIFQVAAGRDVTIIRVEGEDTQTLVVGELPFQGELVLVKDGDVVLTNVRPDADDSMLPEVRLSSRATPFIWARLDSEQDEPE